MSLTDIIELAKSMGLVLGAAFYAAIVFWTYKDARKRLEDPILVATATAVSMLPVVGVFIYMLMRPSEYLADVRERELEIRALERQLGRQERCPYCKSHIEGDYLSCPVCSTKLRQSCTGCDKPLDPRWVLCPYCETEVPGKGGGRGPSGPSGGSSSRRSSTAVNTSSREPRSARRDRGDRGDRGERGERSERSSSKRDSGATVVTSAVRASDEVSSEQRGSDGDDIRTEPFS